MLSTILAVAVAGSGTSYHGRFISGEGDPTYLQALDSAYAMLRPSATMACLPMLYMREWNGFVEGPTWDAWWIQNSFGPSFTMMPFLTEPYQTWLTNSQAMWFAAMGDGKRADQNGFVAPPGCLCDAATKKIVYYRQGDGNPSIHDWCMGFTIAGLLLESELMLVKRDPAEIAQTLPKLETVAGFIDSRRDPKTNLILGGIASNLLAPSYGGWLKPDGSRDKAYLAELSVNYVAALDRLIEVRKLAKKSAKTYEQTRDKVKKALKNLMTPEGYFIHALNPDGTKQGVFGAAKSGYFEAAPNHDAMCFRVVDDKAARRIYDMIASIPEIRPHDLILPNYPSYDTMYDTEGLFLYGVWVNGGHWTTAEARMMMGYARVGAYHDALASFGRILHLAEAFRADNNLTDRGAQLYQPGQPYNVVYDCWGAPGALLRGAFEYVYAAEGLRLYPHIPRTVTKLVQSFPVCFGKRRIFVSAAGAGPITGMTVNGMAVGDFAGDSALVKPEPGEGDLYVQLLLGDAKPFDVPPAKTAEPAKVEDPQMAKVAAFAKRLTEMGQNRSYVAAQAALILEMAAAQRSHQRLRASGRLPEPAIPNIPQADAAAVVKLYDSTVQKLLTGLKDWLRDSAPSEVKSAAKGVGLID